MLCRNQIGLNGNGSTGKYGVTTLNAVRYRLAIKIYCEWKQKEKRVPTIVGARSSGEEHCLHTAGVASSNLAAPTIYPCVYRAFYS